MSSSHTTSPSHPSPRTNFFYHGANPSLDHLDPPILNASAGSEDFSLSEAVAEYLGYLHLVTTATQESAIVDFSAHTLRLLGFNERKTLVRTRYIIPLTICGDASKAAQTDVCLLHLPTLVLLVLVEDKTLSTRTDAEAQVVAGAIAAFQFNNTKRGDNGLPLLNSMTIPCITRVLQTIPTPDLRKTWRQERSSGSCGISSLCFIRSTWDIESIEY